jgi:microcystin-dependent protein
MEATQFLRQQSLQNQINALAERPDKMTPTGSILIFAGSVAPTGWLFCDGSSVSSTTYPELYAVIGTTYGGVDGNFNLPNLVERFVKGATIDDLATTGGGTITIITENLPEHSHLLTNGIANVTSTAQDHTHSLPSLLQQSGGGVGWGHQGNITGSAITETGTNSLYTITSTINGATDNSTAPSVPEIPVVPSFLALHHIIYAGN